VCANNCVDFTSNLLMRNGSNFSPRRRDNFVYTNKLAQNIREMVVGVSCSHQPNEQAEDSHS
jgi:hypothetical protein